MGEPPVGQNRGLLYFSDGSLAYAGHYMHQDIHPDHTHSFVEIAVMVGGAGRHRSVLGDQQLRVGDVVLLRPGVWHGYEQCQALDLYNCCFSVDLLHRELAWTREDPLLGYLLWTGPYAMQRRGMLTAHLSPTALTEAIEHLDALDRIRAQPDGPHRGDIIGRLTLFLSVLSRAVATDRATAPTHPAVTHAMRLMEADLARRWTLTELAGKLGISAGYLVRIFKATTGLPPVAYLSRHRVETAANLLLHTDEPITQIAQDVGWPDQNYFARRFRAHYGLSASTYRARFTHGRVRLGAGGRPVQVGGGHG
ncbi:AraC family transcriptional regulator [Actinoplanes sp. NPDC024001]|uniref:helix-turn-helix transcriptional regulator n=1 Tax=Actinoplanes sp. NPDC024001 TaxID=3154598 RepID=UPI0034115C1E